MKRILLILAGVFGLLLVVALTIPFFVPKSVYKAQIEKAASSALDREVLLTGDVNVSVFPRISASVGGVTVANPQGFSTPNMIEAGELRGSVKWLPLLSRRVEVQEISFVDANVQLEKLADGRSNWAFGTGTTEDTGSSGEGGGVEASIGKASLKNAALTYRDEAAGKVYELADLNLDASMQGFDKPLKANADGVFQNQAFDVAMTVDTPAAIQNGAPATIDLKLDSKLARAAYDGTLTLGETPALDGALILNTPDLAALAAFAALDLPVNAAPFGGADMKGTVSGPLSNLVINFDKLSLRDGLLNLTYAGTVALGGDGRLEGRLDTSSKDLRALLTAAEVELPPGETLQRFSAAGDVSGSFRKLSVAGLSLSLDDIKAEGTAGIDLSGAKPRLTGDLDMGALDLSPFLAASDQEQKPQQPMQGWSKEPLDLAGLKAVNADLNVRTTSLTLGNVTLKNASVVSKLQNGRLNADLPGFDAFGGNWDGKLMVDASGQTPAVSLTMDGQQVGMASLLGTLAGFDKLTGTGAFSVNASATGTSIDEIMHALNGDISTNLSEGAIKGLNVAQLVRSRESLQQALVSGNLQSLDFAAALSPEAETDFTSFNTVLSVRNGVANVDLMKLLNPVIGIDGTGNINLGGQTLDLRLATSVDKTAQGTGSVIQLNGIPVPVRLSGAWTNLKVSPDLSGVTSALQADIQGKILQELGGSDDGSSSVNPLADILGLPGKTQTPAADPAEEDSEDEDTTAEAEPESPEDVAREAITGLIFGKKPKEDDSED